MHWLKNKHIVLAMFVAPVLAIIAYFATDYIVSEEPLAAKQGNSYKLSANPDCRYQSGQCTLRNGDIELGLRVRRITDSSLELTVHSNLPAQKVLASFDEGSATDEPVELQSIAPEKTVWHATFNVADPENRRLRLAIDLSGSLFYAEVPTIFIDYDTSYSRDNFSN
jgi:hypothetical protein